MTYTLMGNAFNIMLLDDGGHLDGKVRDGFLEFVTRQALPWEVTIGNRQSVAMVCQQMQQVDQRFDAFVGMIKNEPPEKKWFGNGPLLIATYSQSPHPDAAVHVALDDDIIAEVAVQHFLNRNIDCLASVQLASKAVADRQRAFLSCCRKHGLEPAVYRPEPDPDPEGHLAAWLKRQRHPVGILTHDDRSAEWLTKLCTLRDVDIPGQVAILGVNNNTARCESINPTVSSVIIPWKHVGTALGQGLHRIWSGASSSQRMVCRPMAVCTRQSTSMQPKDLLMAKAAQLLRPTKRGMANIAEVAEAIGLSRRQLLNRFQYTYGYPPKEWQQRDRLESAKVALMDSDLSVAEIASMLHFNNYSHFSLEFKKRMGLSPRAFRESSVVRG